jgi:hypothetical protein
VCVHWMLHRRSYSHDVRCQAASYHIHKSVLAISGFAHGSAYRTKASFELMPDCEAESIMPEEGFACSRHNKSLGW